MNTRMHRIASNLLLAGCAAAIALCAAADASAQVPANCREGERNGAQWRVCVPQEPIQWNHDVVVYAHGYVSPTLPVALPDDELGELPVQDIVLSMGYAYATTSYRANGLVVPQAVEDLADLVREEIRNSREFRFDRVFLVGVSEGGLIATLALEKYPDLFTGGLSACGPIGDFRRQINYFGDFLVVFNYFFPNMLAESPLLGTPLGIPRSTMENWESKFVPAILAALEQNPSATRQLLRVTRIPLDPADPESVQETILGILWYCVFSTNNAIEVLGGRAVQIGQPGQPGQAFDNTRKWYSGSDNDFKMNVLIQRVAASSAALARIEAGYQASGRISRPLITIHTTGDPVVPFWHQITYGWKAIQSASASLHLGIPVFRYGHVNLTLHELKAAFSAMVFAADAQNLFMQIVPALRILITDYSF